jgi:hypothetical protein
MDAEHAMRRTAKNCGRDEMSIFGQCDCCERRRFLVHTWTLGTETWACQQCCGINPRDCDEDIPEEMNEDE